MISPILCHSVIQTYLVVRRIFKLTLDRCVDVLNVLPQFPFAFNWNHEYIWMAQWTHKAERLFDQNAQWGNWLLVRACLYGWQMVFWSLCWQLEGTVHIHGNSHAAHVKLPYTVVGAFLCGYHTAPMLPYSSHVSPIQGSAGIPMWLPYSSHLAPAQLTCGSIEGGGGIPVWLPYSSTPDSMFWGLSPSILGIRNVTVEH